MKTRTVSNPRFRDRPELVGESRVVRRQELSVGQTVLDVLFGPSVPRTFDGYRMGARRLAARPPDEENPFVVVEPDESLDLERQELLA